MVALPGKSFKANPTATGHTPIYKANGMLSYIFTLATLCFLVNSGRWVPHGVLCRDISSALEAVRVTRWKISRFTLRVSACGSEVDGGNFCLPVSTFGSFSNASSSRVKLKQLYIHGGGHSRVGHVSAICHTWTACAVKPDASCHCLVSRVKPGCIVSRFPFLSLQQHVTSFKMKYFTERLVYRNFRTGHMSKGRVTDYVVLLHLRWPGQPYK